MLEWGLDENFKLTYVEEANASLHTYFCPECREKLDVKNHDFEFRTKRKHFSHSFGRKCSNASNESDLHRNTKLWLYEKLTIHKSFCVYIKCKIGGESQYIEYDLLEDVDEALLEKQTIGGLKPDISLMRKGVLVKAIEIIHKHDDTEQKTVLYKGQKIKEFKFFTGDLVYKKLLRGSAPVVYVNNQPLFSFLSM